MRRLVIAWLQPLGWILSDYRWYRKLVGGTWYRMLELKMVQGGFEIWRHEAPKQYQTRRGDVILEREMWPLHLNPGKRPNPEA